MAEPSWKEKTAPLRRANETVRSSATVLRELGRGQEFLRLLDALDRLPGAATFHPFAVTGQWQLEFAAPDPPSAQEQLKPDQAFMERLQRVSCRPEPLKLVTGPKGVTANPDERRTANDSAKETTPAQAGEERNPEPAPVAPKTGAENKPGAWLALGRIAELTWQLEQQTMAPSARQDAMSSARTAAPLPRNEAGPRRQQQTAATALAPGSPRPSAAAVSQPTTKANGAKAGDQETKPRAASSPLPPAQTQDGFTLLNQYLEVLFQPAAGETKPGHAPSPAERGRIGGNNPTAANTAQEPPTAVPRAPSLLLAGTEAPVADPSAKSSKEALAAQRSETTATAAKTGEIAGNDGGRGHENPEERINRALKEQAWLRGGDLT
ncbi:MAG: hypothetical protein P8X63_04935 [Desulfuromonadaceae bacterium]